MRVLVTGGRDYRDKARAWGLLDAWRERLIEPIDFLIHGGASGADTLAGNWAIANGIHEVIVPALWGYYDKQAGPIRNRVMRELLVHGQSLVLAFPGGRGTADMKRLAADYGYPITNLE
jgi:hypothetical protein